MNPSSTLETIRVFVLRAFCLVLLLLGFLPSLRAGQFGLFTYERVEDTIEITGYPQDAVGAVEIPAVIEGLPVTRLGYPAFQGIKGLTSVTLPVGLTSIGYLTFAGCTGLVAIHVEAGNPSYVSDGGVLFDTAQTTLVQFPPGRSGNYDVPANVTRIGGYAFSRCTGLTNVTIASSVTSIDSGAFSGCTGLTSVSIPARVTEIGDWTFHGCIGLTSVSLSHSLTSIGEAAFLGCTGLAGVTITSSVTRIGDRAFSGCTRLVAIHVETGNSSFVSDGGVLFSAAQTTLVQFPQGRDGNYAIPASVTSIDSGAFGGCTGLTNVTLPSSLVRIGSHAFVGCAGLTSVSIPARVTEIGDWTFHGCIGLTSVTLPSSLIRIGGHVFYGCTGLTNVTLHQGLKNLGGSMFSGCTGLASVSIPSSVTEIGDWAFNACTGLTNVTFQQGLKKLGRGMFYGCTGLTSVSIPPSVTEIGDARTFGDCTGLNAIHVKAGNPAYASDNGVLFNAAKTSLLLFPQGKRAGHYDIPASVTSIVESAFSGCSGLTSVTLPASVTRIGVRAFAGCSGLTSVTLPEGLTTISERAFVNCTGLTNVSLPEDLTTIEAGAFVNCTGLTSVTIPASVTVIGWEIPRHPPVYFYYPAFSGCTALTKAVFLGDAPFLVKTEFSNAAPGFTIHYLSSRQGFTSPTWIGHPATMINEATYPAASWLLTHGLWYDTQLDLDPDGDGVDLLTAYALNLDPRVNLRGRLPAPVLRAGSLSLNFHASTPGITYRVETSTDLTDWTTTGVTQTAPAADGRSTASVLRDAPHRFLRLVVQD